MPAREGSDRLLFYVRYPYYRLRVFCPNPRCVECGKVKRLNPYALKDHLRRNPTLTEIAEMTSCRVCGHRPGKLFVDTLNDRVTQI